MANKKEVRHWMDNQMHMFSNWNSATELAESAAHSFDMDEVLDDETHWIWDEAMDSFMEYE